MNLKRKRGGFVLIMAIGLLVLFSALTGMIISLSSDSYSSTGKIYLYNQAKLLARSGIEMAILMIEDRVPTDPCLQNLEIIDGDFNISVEINYVGRYQNCDVPSIVNFVADESNGSIIVDVYVRTINNGEKIVFHRKTAQKP